MSRADEAIGLPGVMRALLGWAACRRDWLATPELWFPDSDDPAEQYFSLVAHLFSTIRVEPDPVPRFLSRVWLEPESNTSLRHRKVFKHVARGFGIRGADVPLRLTKGMARYLADVPEHFTVEQGVRWCEVRGLGADEPLATAIARTDLGRVFWNPEFWRDVLTILVDHRVSPEFATLAIDHARTAPEEFCFAGHERLSNGGFERLKSRIERAESLCWKPTPRPNAKWAPLGVPGFRRTDTSDDPWSTRSWTIRELLTTSQLRSEGRLLRHCVADYEEDCIRGSSSIWSMRRSGTFTEERVLTIEVQPRRRRIVTALGHCNRRPTGEQRAVMNAWANRAGLSIASWV